MEKMHQAEAYMHVWMKICDEKGKAYRALYLTHCRSLVKELCRRFKKGDKAIQKAHDALTYANMKVMSSKEVKPLKTLAGIALLDFKYDKDFRWTAD